MVRLEDDAALLTCGAVTCATVSPDSRRAGCRTSAWSSAPRTRTPATDNQPGECHIAPISGEPCMRAARELGLTGFTAYIAVPFRSLAVPLVTTNRIISQTIEHRRADRRVVAVDLRCVGPQSAATPGSCPPRRSPPPTPSRTDHQNLALTEAVLGALGEVDRRRHRTGHRRKPVDHVVRPDAVLGGCCVSARG